MSTDGPRRSPHPVESTAYGPSDDISARAGGDQAPRRWAERRPWRDILTSVGLVCMAIVFFESVAGILPDGTMFWLITPVRAVLIVGLVAMALVVPHPSAWRTWLDIPLLVLVLTSLVASFGRTESMAAWRWLLTEVGLYYLVVMVRRQHRDSHRAGLVLVLVGVATAGVLALQQAASQTPTGFCRAPGQGMADGCEQPGALVRVVGTLNNPNLLAAFLLLFLPLAWLAVDEWLNSASRLAGVVLVALGYLALVQTWSRAGLAAGMLGIVALFTLARPTGRRLRIGGGLLAVGLVVAVAMAIVSGAGVRTKLWTAALSLAVHHPLGVGLGRSGALLTEAVPDSLQFQHAHDTWLNWLVEAGWLGFLAVMAITALVCWRVWRSTVEGSRIAAALGAGLLGFGLMSLTDHPANALRIALALAFAIGLVMASPVADQRILVRPSDVVVRPEDREPVAAQVSVPVTAQVPVPVTASIPAPDDRGRAPEDLADPYRDVPSGRRDDIPGGQRDLGAQGDPGGQWDTEAWQPTVPGGDHREVAAGRDPYAAVEDHGWTEPAPMVAPAQVQPVQAEPAWGEQAAVEQTWGEQTWGEQTWGEQTSAEPGWGEQAPVEETWGEQAPVEHTWGEQARGGSSWGEPTWGGSSWSDPASTDPSWSDPTWTDPGWNDPSRAEPAGFEPMPTASRAEPTRAEPTGAGHAWGEPAPVEPARTEPVPAYASWGAQAPRSAPVEPSRPAQSPVSWGRPDDPESWARHGAHRATERNRPRGGRDGGWRG
ncbi:O-antigen ligase family protein [Raineyella sp. LH-20]|uniref:O-antigen ligase family protein n=1 Tax=Raineyella sp. LH-20 TaxID=3081204 RepID=UPI002955730B|nr:O-antigen ligase family protein [Raineyella sp. LH-20]WOP17529.1 O-antigen ligase family protein [Raineyella sp. LH-20]